MKTAKGNNYSTLLNVDAINGMMSIRVKVPMTLDVNSCYLSKLIPFINDVIVAEKKGSGVYEKSLLQIEHHMEQLKQAYLRLFESYDYAIGPKTKQSPTEKAWYTMLESIPDNKMLRAMCALHIGQDKAADFVLPGEKDQLIDATVQAMRAAQNSNKD